MSEQFTPVDYVFVPGSQAEIDYWKQSYEELKSAASAEFKLLKEYGERAAALREAVTELLAAVEHYDDVRANAKDPGRVGSIIKLARETDITPREHWRPEATRLFNAILAASGGAAPADVHRFCSHTKGLACDLGGAAPAEQAGG